MNKRQLRLLCGYLPDSATEIHIKDVDSCKFSCTILAEDLERFMRMYPKTGRIISHPRKHRRGKAWLANHLRVIADLVGG